MMKELTIDEIRCNNDVLGAQNEQKMCTKGQTAMMRLDPGARDRGEIYDELMGNSVYI